MVLPKIVGRKKILALTPAVIPRLAYGWAGGLLLAACLAVSLHQVGTFGVETDFYGVYAPQAERILGGKTYTYQLNPPGYCLILAGLTFFLGNTFLAAKIISAISLPLLFLVIYFLLRALVDDKLALISSILCSLTFFPYSFLASMDLVATLAILLPLCFFYSRDEARITTYIMTGFLSGVAYLFRSNAIFIPLGFILVICLNKSQQNRMTKITVFFAGFLLVVSPWLLYNKQINGSWLASQVYLQIAANFYHPQGDNFLTSIQSMSNSFHSLTEVFLYKPCQLITKYLRDVFLLNIPKMFIPSAGLKSYSALGIFPLLWVSWGMVVLSKDTKNQPLINFVLISFLGYLLLGLVGFHRRYYFFFYPCIFLIKLFPFWMVSKIRRKKTLLLSFIVIVALAGMGETALTLAQEPRYLLPISQFLRHNTSRGEVMIVRKPHLAYLGGLIPSFPLAYSAAEYGEKAQEIGAKYIVYSNYEAQLWPGLKSLSNPELVSPGWHLIYQHPPTGTLIYQDE